MYKKKLENFKSIDDKLYLIDFGMSDFYLDSNNKHKTMTRREIF